MHLFHCSKLCLVSVGCSSYLNSNSYSFIHTAYLCTKWLLFNAAFGNWELHSFGRSEFDLYKLVNQKLSFFSYLQKWWWIQACCAHNSRKSGTIMISSKVFQLYRNNCKYCVIVRLTGKHQINAILCKSYLFVVRQHDRKLKTEEIN